MMVKPLNRFTRLLRIGSCFLLWINIAVPLSSENPSIDWDQLFGELADRATDEETLERWSDQLLALSEQPLALNQANREALETLPFLGAAQVEALSYYLYRYGPMEDLSELALIEGLDATTIDLILPFVCLGEVNPKKAQEFSMDNLNYGKHTFSHLVGSTLETKAGYKRTTSEQDRYRGDAYSQTFRYAYALKRHLQAGFTLQKDAGEPWRTNKGWPDYYTLHLVLKDMGFFKGIYLGDYTLTMGQGLTCGQGFQLGKTLTGTSTSANQSALKRHASTAESGFFRGAAVEFVLWEKKQPALKTIQINGIGFVSHQRMDGRMKGDTLTSLLSTGLHRSQDEMDQRKTVPVWTVGGRLGCTFAWGRLHLNGLVWRLDKPYFPTYQPYNRFGFKGQSGGGLSMDYKWQYQRFGGFGECAISENGQTAWIQGLNVSACSSLALSLVYRMYERGYQTLYGQAFGEHETVNNEEGWYLFVGWEIGAKLSLHGNIDLFRFPWLTYTTDEPAYGQETGLLATYRWASNSKLRLRYKSRLLERNHLPQGGRTPQLIAENKQTARLQQESTWGAWKLKSTLSAAWLTTEKEDQRHTGCAFTQSMTHTHPSNRLRITCNLSWFDITDYAVRLSTYQPGLPGSFSMPLFEGTGCHWQIMMMASPWSWMETWVKLSRWNYTDRNQVGTASEQLSGHHKTDLQLMVRFKMGKRPQTRAKSLLPLQN